MEALQQCQWALCLQLLAQLAPPLPLAAVQASAVAHVHMLGAQLSWQAIIDLPWKVPSSQAAGMEGDRVGGRGANDVWGESTAFGVARSYRKLAALVHPDKCRMPHSESAFKMLGQAQQQVLGLQVRGRGTGAAPSDEALH